MVHKLQRKNIAISGEEIFLPTTPEEIPEAEKEEEEEKEDW
jgi:hypothetical protein